jgi:hypothetical protein
MATGQASPKVGKVVDIPANAPTIGTATDLVTDGKISVTFTAPSTTTGGPIFSYTALSSPGSITGTATSSPITVSGLTNNTAYTFTVAGVNGTGTGPYSSASNSATPTVPPYSYESIATVTLSSGQSSITFTSIPQTYKHLQIRCFSRDSRSATALNNWHLGLNGDTANNYSVQTLSTDSSTVSAASDPNLGKTDYFIQPSVNTTSTVFQASVWDIIDYSNTNKYKTIRAFGGYDNNGSGRINFSGAGWRSLDGVTSLTFTNSSNANFNGYSSYALYGIKG